jgi:hypothetical protein
MSVTTHQDHRDLKNAIDAIIDFAVHHLFLIKSWVNAADTFGTRLRLKKSVDSRFVWNPY